MELLILRPEPGASATAARAAALGLDPIVSPLFAIEPLAWSPPDAADYDAVMMTSANAARHGGRGLARYAHLPGYAVGGATAAAMRDAGLFVAEVGDRDASALLARVRDAGARRVLHLCGEQASASDDLGLAAHAVPVYAASAVAVLSHDAAAAARRGAVALLHSPRAACRFARLLDAADIERHHVAITAISDAAARAAGVGWKAVATAPTPSDAAMLAIALALCQNPRPMSARS